MEEGFLHLMEQEEIICPRREEETASRNFSAQDLENLRLAKLLMEDLEVNLSGVEIILRMRQCMIEMRRQFDAILEDLARQVQVLLQERS